MKLGGHAAFTSKFQYGQKLTITCKHSWLCLTSMNSSLNVSCFLSRSISFSSASFWCLSCSTCCGRREDRTKVIDSMCVHHIHPNKVIDGRDIYYACQVGMVIALKFGLLVYTVYYKRYSITCGHAW